MDEKSIVIYFSRADENYSVGYIEKGNTEVIAEYIKELSGADLFKVERKEPYPKDYQSCIEESKQEQLENKRPELKEYLEDISSYKVVYIGSPIYWGTMPNPMFTQLEKLNWSGKIIRVFTTHEGSGLANVVNDIKKICQGATILDDSLAIYGHNVLNSKDKVSEWLTRKR